MDPGKYKVKKNCRKIFNKKNNEKMWVDFMELKEQNNIISQSQNVAAAKKYPCSRDLPKVFQSTYITFVENIYSRA